VLSFLSPNETAYLKHLLQCGRSVAVLYSAHKACEFVSVCHKDPKPEALLLSSKRLIISYEASRKSTSSFASSHLSSVSLSVNGL
jgi:hypothetical protein